MFPFQFKVSYQRPLKFSRSADISKSINITVNSSITEKGMDVLHDFLVPKYELHDFQNAEECKVIRMIFQLSQVPYEFKTVQRDDYLEDYPFYALPMLQMNDRKYGSILSICRHLAWRYNLSGKTAYDDAQVDDIAEKVFEVRMKIKNWLDHIEHGHDHTCDEICTNIEKVTNTTEKLFAVLERQLQTAPSSWLIGHSITWVDLLVACLVNPIIFHRPKLLQNFPMLYLHNEKVAHHNDLVGFLYRVRDRKYQLK